MRYALNHWLLPLLRGDEIRAKSLAPPPAKGDEICAKSLAPPPVKGEAGRGFYFSLKGKRA
ncbi:hypothetical protein GCM10009084_21980 [Marinomonas primoryensis]